MRRPRSAHAAPGLALLWAFASPHGAIAADPAADRLLVAQCAQCHGTDSNPYAGFERLAGKDYRDLYDDLVGRLFEDDPGELDLMTHQTQGYTLSQIDRIARYLSALPR